MTRLDAPGSKEQTVHILGDIGTMFRHTLELLGGKDLPSGPAEWADDVVEFTRDRRATSISGNELTVQPFAGSDPAAIPAPRTAQQVTQPPQSGRLNMGLKRFAHNSIHAHKHDRLDAAGILYRGRDADLNRCHRSRPVLRHMRCH